MRAKDVPRDISSRKQDVPAPGDGAASEWLRSYLQESIRPPFGHMASIPGILCQPTFQSLPGRITQVLDHLGRTTWAVPPGPLASAWRNTVPPHAVVLRDRTYEDSLIQSPRKRQHPLMPEKLRTLDHGRPWRDDRFAACRVSSSRDMSR